jgi:hypothetical protein
MSAALLAMLILTSCAPKENSPDGIGRNDIIILSDKQVSNFINILPALLKFSDDYNSKLSPSEKDATNADLKFFEAIASDPSVRKITSLYNFSSTGEMITVYKNVVLEYTSITRNFTNYQADLESLKQTIDSFKSNYTIGLQDKSLNDEDRKIILSRLKDLAEDEKRVSNIITVKKFEKQIDDVYVNYYKKKD